MRVSILYGYASFEMRPGLPVSKLRHTELKKQANIDSEERKLFYALLCILLCILPLPS